jgi:hypothetical protein
MHSSPLSFWQRAFLASFLVLLCAPSWVYAVCCPGPDGRETFDCIIGGPQGGIYADTCGYCPECPNNEYIDYNPDANSPDWDGWDKLCLCEKVPARSASPTTCVACSNCERKWQCRGEQIYYAQGSGTGGATRYCAPSWGPPGVCLVDCPVVVPARIEVRPIAGPGLTECQSDDDEVWEVDYSRCEDCRGRSDCSAGIPLSANLTWSFGSAQAYYDDRGRQVGFVPQEVRRRPKYACVGQVPSEMKEQYDSFGNCRWELQPINRAEPECDTREVCCTDCDPGRFRCKEQCVVGVPPNSGDTGSDRGGSVSAYCRTVVTASCPTNGWVEGATGTEGCGGKGSCEHNFPSPLYPNSETKTADCVVPGSIRSLPWSEPGGASGVITTGETGVVAYSCDIEGGGRNFCCVGATPPNYGLLCGMLNPGPTPIGTIPGWPTPPGPPTPTPIVQTPGPDLPIKPTLPPVVRATPPGGGSCEDREREIYLNPRTGRCCSPGEWPLGDGCCQYEGIQPDGTCCPPAKRCGGGCCGSGEVCVNPADKSCCPPLNRCGLLCCANPGECDSVTGQCCPVDQRCGKACCGSDEKCVERGGEKRCVDKAVTPTASTATPTPTPTPTPTVVVGNPPQGREVFVVG